MVGIKEQMLGDAEAILTSADNREVIKENCENLPWNLIVAVQNNPKMMLQYFTKHAKDCGNFPQDMSGDSQEMLEWLNDHYAKFSEKRKNKIDKACKKYAPEGYLPPIVEQYYVEDIKDLIHELNQMGASLPNNCSLDDVREAYLKIDPKKQKDVCKYISRELDFDLGYMMISCGFPVGKDAYRAAVSSYNQQQENELIVYHKLLDSSGRG